MSRNIIPVGYDLETGQFVTWEDGDDIVPMPIDLFGSVPVAHKQTLFSRKNRFNTGPYVWRAIGTNHTVTHKPHSSAIELSIPGANGDSITFQSKKYIPYQPGKEQGWEITFVPSGFSANRTFEIGTYDDQNGMFYRLSGANPDPSFVIYSFTNGTSVVPETATRSQWSVDKFDGSGPSKLTMDFTKSQIIYCRYQWLGVGTVEFGFSINGKLWPAHRFEHANIITDVYMSTATLPVRCKIYNSGAATGTGKVLYICTEVHSTGGENTLDVEGIPYTASNIVEDAITGLSLNSNTRQTLIAIRMKTSVPAGVRNTMIATAISPWLNSLSRITWIGLLYIPAEDIQAATASITGGSWTSVHTTSGVEYNTGITAVTRSTNSIYIHQDAVDKTTTLAELQRALVGLPLALNIEGTHSDVLLLQVQRLEANNNTVWGGLNWKEIQ